MLGSFHPETTQCHYEPFDALRTDSVKNLIGPSDNGILRRPAMGEPSQNDTQKQGFRMDTGWC